MMTRKREMAEWILDFFRRVNADAGHIVMMRNVQNKLLELNPRERDLFVPVANELIANGYFTYEEGTLQSLRLTQKGRDYIYPRCRTRLLSGRGAHTGTTKVYGRLVSAFRFLCWWFEDFYQWTDDTARGNRRRQTVAGALLAYPLWQGCTGRGEGFERR